jgi:hypothetical protein
MAELKARMVTHRGTLPASGFLLESELVGEAEARHRILALWQSKSRVYGLKDGLLLLLPNPVLVTAEEAIGTPLVYHDGFLLGAPLSVKELRALQAPFGSLVRVRGGRITFETLDENLFEKPENWIDTSGFEFVQGESLGAVPSKPALVAQPEVLDLREKLGGLPKPPVELNELLALLKTGKAPQRDPDARGFLRFSFRRVSGSIREWFRMLASLWPRTTDQSESLTGAKQSVFATRPVSRFSIWLNSLVTRLAMVPRFARVLGWRQGRYLSRVMDMFEHGDIDEALRHAIPLSSIADSPIMRFSFWGPRYQTESAHQPCRAPIKLDNSIGTITLFTPKSALSFNIPAVGGAGAHRRGGLRSCGTTSSQRRSCRVSRTPRKITPGCRNCRSSGTCTGDCHSSVVRCGRKTARHTDSSQNGCFPRSRIAS